MRIDDSKNFIHIRMRQFFCFHFYRCSAIGYQWATNPETVRKQNLNEIKDTENQIFQCNLQILAIVIGEI